MSRSVDPADRNRTIALISLQGDQFPRSALYLAASKISLAALMTGGSREVMRKCAMISPMSFLIGRFWRKADIRSSRTTARLRR